MPIYLSVPIRHQAASGEHKVGANPWKGGNALRTYEFMSIVQPGLDEEGLNALTERIQQVITNNGGEIVKVEQMGRRRLAYPIKRQREGYYVLMHARMSVTAIAELDRACKLSDDILRYLLLQIEEEQTAEV